MAHFEKAFKHLRLDREQDKGLWRRGNVYQNGNVNELYRAYIRGYQCGKRVEMDAASQLAGEEVIRCAACGSPECKGYNCPAASQAAPEKGT